MMTRSLKPGGKALATIALVMIVRDEAASIGRCLQSVSRFVDEMILLDTGSVDATVSIAEGLGAKVFHWAWQNDFAAARNQALEHSSADWNLVLDADEWVVGDGSLLRQAVASLPAGGALFLGLLPIYSEINLRAGSQSVIQAEAGESPSSAVSCSWEARLLPRDVRYVGRIHEQVQSDLPHRRLAVDIAHDGFLRSNLEQKKGRNRKLLQDAIADDPGDAYLHYQLGKDYEVYDEHALAVACYEAALQSVQPAEGYRHDLVVRMIFCLKKAGLLDLGFQFAADELPHWGHSPDFFFVFADLLIDLAIAQPERALPELLPLAKDCLLECLEIGDVPHLNGTVQGRGSNLAARNLELLNQVMASF
jgi:glycosyltransferase involved in cell wall biosynthesis